MTTETIWLDSAGCVTAAGFGATPVEVPRLSEADAYAALENFRADRFVHLSDSDYDDAAAGCRILYRDDYDAGRSWWMCVDGDGDGDDSGWAEVPR